MTTVTQSVSERILANLTVTEKIALLHQHAPAVPREGLSSFHTGAEAAHGVAWLGDATVFPQMVGLAAAWDKDLLRRVGWAVGEEMRAKKAADPTVSLNVWAPVVNPLRHPLWGRNEEGFSEDPRLTAELSSAYCAGLKGDHPEQWLTVPTLKHFLGYNNELDRNVTSSQLSPRVLHEYELPAYQLAVESGVAGAVMLSYNLVNGRPAHVSDLVASHLRKWENGDSLAIVTDAGAPSALFKAEKYFDDGPGAYAAALRAGVDSFTDDGDDPAPSVSYLEEALARGLITEGDIDAAVSRLLVLRERTGEFLPDGGAYGSIGQEALLTAGHAALAREAVRKSVVLLRNAPVDGEQLLPLGDETGKVAVIGLLGSRVLSDWYSGKLTNPVSISEGLAERYGDVLAEDGLDTVALRCNRTDAYLSVPPDSGSLTADSANAGSPELFRIKDWGNGEYTLQSSLTGRFLSGEDGYLRSTSDRVGGWVVQETFGVHHAVDGSVALRHVASGKWVRVEEGTGSAVLVTGVEADADRFTVRTVRPGLEAAGKAAAEAEVAVVVVGNDPHLGGRETLDRSTLELPQAEQELIRVVREANTRTVLLIVSSYPYALGSLADAPAIVWASHGGQELGRGLADVLSGDHEPQGRLAQTWWADDADLPDILDYDIIGSRSTYLYSEAEPLYPFGHGMGYAPVTYRSLELTGEGSARVAISNDGGRAASELVQVYGTSDRPGFPRRILLGYSRVLIPAGGTASVDVHFDMQRLATYSLTAERMIVEPGQYSLLAGSSAGNLPFSVDLEVTGEASPPRPRGQWVRAKLFDQSINLELVPETPLRGTAVAPVRSARPYAAAVYSGWSGTAPTHLGLRVARCDGATVRVQAVGQAGTWRDWASASLKPGFSGEAEVALADFPSGMPASFRILLEGQVAISDLLVP